MIQRLPVIIALVCTLAFGCRRSEETRSAGETSPASELQTSTDTSVTTTGSTGGTVSALSPSDKEFVMKAAQSNLADVQLGLLTGRNTTNEDVRAFGRRMAQDHGKTLEEIRALVTLKGLVLPSEPDAEHIKMARDLVVKSGRDFDRSYLAAMVSEHEKDIAAFDEASRTAQDPDIKALAIQKLPILREHLAMAKETQTKLK